MGQQIRKLSVENKMEELCAEINNSVHSSLVLSGTDFVHEGKLLEGSTALSINAEEPSVVSSLELYNAQSGKKSKLLEGSTALSISAEEPSVVSSLELYNAQSGKKSELSEGGTALSINAEEPSVVSSLELYNAQSSKKSELSKGSIALSISAEEPPVKAVKNPMSVVKSHSGTKQHVAHIDGINHKTDFLIPSPRGMSIKDNLKQSENLRMAQERINSLEAEINNLRIENEDLTATAEVFEERLDQIIIQHDKLKITYAENREEFKEEKNILMITLKEQTRELEKKTIKTKDLEKRLSGNIQHIRVRERELENRLELIKLDKQNLTIEKDRYILNLKRELETLKEALNNQQNKQNEKVQKINDYRNQSRNATHGLQMVLQVLKGNNISEDLAPQATKSTKKEE